MATPARKTSAKKMRIVPPTTTPTLRAQPLSAQSEGSAAVADVQTPTLQAMEFVTPPPPPTAQNNAMNLTPLEPLPDDDETLPAEESALTCLQGTAASQGRSLNPAEVKFASVVVKHQRFAQFGFKAGKNHVQDIHVASTFFQGNTMPP